MQRLETYEDIIVLTSVIICAFRTSTSSLWTLAAFGIAISIFSHVKCRNWFFGYDFIVTEINGSPQRRKFPLVQNKYHFIRTTPSHFSAMVILNNTTNFHSFCYQQESTRSPARCSRAQIDPKRQHTTYRVSSWGFGGWSRHNAPARVCITNVKYFCARLE